MTHVAICVATFRRPVWLRDLLESLSRLDVDVMTAAALHIVVVDNDPAGSARSVVDELRPSMPWPLEYATELERGIAQARNRAVAVALASDPEFVAFIDDDEIAERDWLRELLRIQQTYGADVVQGPVQPLFDSGAPHWVRAGRFFERTRHLTGTRILTCGAGNVLVARALLNRGESVFDNRFGLSGAEDTHFFLRASREGAKMVYASDAVVTEHVPASRSTAVWLLKRGYAAGSNYATCERILFRSGWRKVVRVAKGLLRIAQGSALLVPAAVAGRAAIVHALETAAVGLGTVTGTLGARGYGRYRTTQGQ